MSVISQQQSDIQLLTQIEQQMRPYGVQDHFKNVQKNNAYRQRGKRPDQSVRQDIVHQRLIVKCPCNSKYGIYKRRHKNM